jgi:hypothetical protein
VLKGMKISVELHQRVPIGRLINDLRKACEDEAVKKAAKKLVLSWQKELSAGHARPRSDAAAASAPTTPASAVSTPATPAEAKAPSVAPPTASVAPAAAPTPLSAGGGARAGAGASPLGTPGGSTALGQLLLRVLRGWCGKPPPHHRWMLRGSVCVCRV